MRRLAIAALSTLVIPLALQARAGEKGEKEDEQHHAPPPRAILVFQTMYGVDGPFIGDTNRIRGVQGDEAPWEIAGSVAGKLFSNGHLRIHVRGLVFKDSPLVMPPSLIGTNDAEQFRGLVSCLTEQGDQTPTVNVTTQGFPANQKGDSDIDAVLALPNPCVAPIVFILPGDEDKWFAVTGVETEGD